MNGSGGNAAESVLACQEKRWRHRKYFCVKENGEMRCVRIGLKDGMRLLRIGSPEEALTQALVPEGGQAGEDAVQEQKEAVAHKKQEDAQETGGGFHIVRQAQEMQEQTVEQENSGVAHGQPQAQTQQTGGQSGNFGP